MTDLIICDSNKENMEQIKNVSFNYYFEKNYEAEVFGFSKIEDAREMIKNQSLLTTCFIECGEPLKALIKDIRNNNKDNYVVIMVNNIQELIEYTTPYIRPAGCLFRPAIPKDIKTMIATIAEDMDDMQEDVNMFTFKIKSREYYVDCRNIILFEAANKKVVLYTDCQEFEFYDSLDAIVSRLPDYFFRTHKSYVINLRQIEEINYKDMEIRLKDELVADLSRNYKGSFVEIMKSNIME